MLLPLTLVFYFKYEYIDRCKYHMVIATYENKELESLGKGGGIERRGDCFIQNNPGGLAGLSRKERGNSCVIWGSTASTKLLRQTCVYCVQETARSSVWLE